MRGPVTIGPRSPRRPLAAAWLLLGLVASGCGVGRLPASAGPSAAPTVPPPPGASSQGVADATPPVRGSEAPTRSAQLTRPPAATLVGTVTGAAKGALGSFTWLGSGTDAPWIAPADASRAVAGSTLEVAFEPAAVDATWTARWAPITETGPGDVADGVDGSGPVSVVTPTEVGAWSLQLEASFGPGRSGTWYWRIEVAP